MKLYHITRLNNLDSILTSGILPGRSKGLLKKNDERSQWVWLTNDVNKIIETQAGDGWRNNIAIIEVHVTNIKPFIYKWNNSESDFEFVCDIVKPEEIIDINIVP